MKTEELGHQARFLIAYAMIRIPAVSVLPARDILRELADDPNVPDGITEQNVEDIALESLGIKLPSPLA